MNEFARRCAGLANQTVDSLIVYLYGLFGSRFDCLHNGPVTVIDTLSTETGDE